MEISCASQVNMVKHGHIIQPSTIVLYGNFWCFIFPANVINHLISDSDILTWGVEKFTKGQYGIKIVCTDEKYSSFD